MVPGILVMLVTLIGMFLSGMNGADILCRAALSDEFAAANGRYFDNDTGKFASPHPDALDPKKCEDVVGIIESVLADRAGKRR